MSKKVLIVTYYWPPSGGISVLRCLKIAKYLRDFGWEPVIYTPSNAEYEFLDYTNDKDIPKGIEMLRHPILEPFNLFKKLSGRKKEDSQNPVYVRDRKPSLVDKIAIWVRGNFFIPDARSLWIRPSVKYLSKYLSENKIDAIFSDGPPHTNTVIACKLSKKFNIPWLSDYQDPWTQVDYYKMFPITKIADWKHRKMEQEAFKVADKITIASPTWAKDLESIGAKNVSPIYYGYDEGDFEGVEANTDNYFSIAHAGQLGIDRSPDILVRVLADLKKEDKYFADKLRIRFAGMVDYSIKQQINELGLSDNYEDLGRISRKESIKLLFDSKILLLPLNKAHNVKGRIPGKIFELLRAGNTILCLGPSDSDSANIVSNCNAGKTIDYDNYDSIKSFIKNLFENYKVGKLKCDTREIERYSNFYQTKLIAEYLNKITLDTKKNVKK